MSKKTAGQILPEEPWSAPKRLLAAALLVTATAAVYRHSLEVPFFFDDNTAILQNTAIRRLWPLTDVLNPPASAGGVTGRPLVNLSLAINYAVGGLDVRGYHATNIALHILAGLTFWGVLRRTLRLAGRRPPQPELFAFGTALLWSLHPLLTESVVCVVQRNEIMGSLFYLLTLYAFIRSVEYPEPGNPARLKSSRSVIAWQIIAFLACLLGVASKEIVATAPLIVLLYDRTFVAGSFGAAWRLRGRFHLALAGTWLLLAALMVGANQRGGTVGFGLGMSSWDYLLTQCRALTIYLKLSVWPHPLVVDYGESVSRLAEVWGRGLFVLALLAGTIWALARKPRLGFLGAGFFLILAPSSSVVPLTTQTIAEHRMYLPLAAVLVLLAAVLWLLPDRARLAVFAALVCGAGWLTFQRTDIYRDEHRLWTDVIARQPDNARAHAALGHYFARKEQWAEALPHFADAVRLRPAYTAVHINIAVAMMRLGRPADALEHYGLAHRAFPHDALINYSYGRALIANGRPAEGIARLEESLRIQPDQPEAHSQLGLALEQMGRPAEAMEHYRTGLRLNPDHAWLHANLGNVLAGFGEWPEAEVEFKLALALKPDFAAVHHNLGRLLVLLDRPAEALPHYEQALTQFAGSAEVHHNFSLALAKTGRVAAAIAQEETALRLDPNLETAREHLAELRRRE